MTPSWGRPLLTALLGGALFALAACSGPTHQPAAGSAPSAVPLPAPSAAASSSTAPSPAPSSARSAQPTPRVPAYFVGDWNGHRRSMTIRPDGTASFHLDTMVTCGHEKPGQPCDTPDMFGVQRLELRMKIDAAIVYLTVVHTNDTPDTPIGTVFRLVPGPDHTMLMRWVSGAGGHHGLPQGIPMCNDKLTKDGKVCGA